MLKTMIYCINRVSLHKSCYYQKLMLLSGNTQDMPLFERVYHCQNCGQVLDRDLNRSINLENWTKNADSLSVNACGQEGAVSLG